MYAKGSFFVARKAHIAQQFGEERWARFIEHLGAREPVFREPILVTSLVPVAAYLSFQEEILREFFGGREEAYWIIGEKSAEWALGEGGPYKNFRNNPQTLRKFVEQSLPLIWTAYFTEGRLSSVLLEDAAEIRIFELPVVHVSFEYTVLGYAKRSLQMIGLRAVTPRRILGVSEGDKEILYEITFRQPLRTG
jgi:hypothetical protein